MAIAAFGVGLVTISQAEAVTTADITVTVTVEFLSFSVVDGAIAFSTVTIGSNTVNAEKQVVTNDGNVAETYTLQLTTTDIYTDGTTETAAGANTYVLQALFTGDAGTAPVSGDFGANTGTADDVVLSASAQTATAEVYSWSTSTGTGASVPAAGVRDLYFKYSAPTSVTSGAQEDLVVTLAASAG